MSQTETQPIRRRTLGQRLAWILKTTLITLMLFTLLVALAGGGWLGFLELQRSFGSVFTSLSITEQNISLLRSDVNGLMAADLERQRQITTLQTDMDSVGNRLAALDTLLVQQGAQLTDLDTRLATTGESLAGTQQDTAELQSALSALQGDVIVNASDIDAVGGELDAARAEVTGLNGRVTTLQTTVETAVPQAITDVDTMQQTIILFRTWDLITRARLRLLEGNVGLATTDAQQANNLLTSLSQNFPSAELVALTAVQTRLNIALTNLSASPVNAALDLELAWDALDLLLTARLPLPPVTVTPQASLTPTMTPTPAVTVLPIVPTPTIVPPGPSPTP